MWTLNILYMENDLHIKGTAYLLPGKEAQILDTYK